jgi:group I intron endonuclease
MKVKNCDKEKCGVYLIRNLINGKVYIGKSINIYKRIIAHICSLTAKRTKEENPHFIAAWHKYGKKAFEYVILEECSFEELSEKELFWMQKYNSTNSKIGYNKRLDSKGGMIPHKETRLKLTKALNKRFLDPDERKKIGDKSKAFWKNNPDRKELMSLNVKLTKQQKYKFLKLSEDNTLIKVYDTVEEIIKENPSYKWQNIYSVCNGYKKRIYGYKWRKELKI